jgi:DNA-binding response OmpR family regulator
MSSPVIPILLFDDESMIVESMARHLKRKGYQPLKAYDSDSALELFHSHRPRICILDIHLGFGSVKTGVDGLEELRADNPDIMCVLFTVSSE